MKLHIYITDPIAFAKGQFDWCFAAYGRDLTHVTDYLYAGAIEVDIDINRQTVVQTALDMLDAQAASIRNKAESELRQIESERQEIRALPHLESVK